MSMLTRRTFATTALATGALMALPPFRQQAAAEVDPWPEIRNTVFGTRPIEEQSGRFALYAPAQAADAALVPVSIHFPAAIAAVAETLTLIIDRNPAPVAATFTFGDAFRSGPAIGERQLSTRLRIDSFSKLRAVLQVRGGELLMESKFVAGAGGCSAVPSKDPEAALASLGKVRVKSAASSAHDPAWREAIVMVKHPNFTGLQMDPKKGAFTPARFVNKLEIRRGDDLILSMDGGISISEDPNLRFVYADSNGAPLSVDGTDTHGSVLSGREGDPGS